MLPEAEAPEAAAPEADASVPGDAEPTEPAPGAPVLYVSVSNGGQEKHVGSFTKPFVIGREEGADVRLDAREVRLRHAEVRFHDGAWWLSEIDRANRTYVGARTVGEVRVDTEVTVRLGWGGPEVILMTTEPVQPLAPEAAGDGAMGDTEPADAPAAARGTDESRELAWARQETATARRAASIAEERGRQRTRIATAAGAAAVILALVVAIGLGWTGNIKQNQLEETMLELHVQIRSTDVTLAKLRALASSRVDPELDAQINEATMVRREQAREYVEGVRQTSLYQPSTVTTEDEAIYRVARALGESELNMPYDFAQKVKEEIHGYWMGRGRGRFIRGIESARAQGVDRAAVAAMEKYGVPHQLFYMALQESDFNADAVGPRTRWGIAKGMWQFIPSTGERYGLNIGPDAGRRVPDPLDDRHNVAKATEAAAKYLNFIYTTDAQSSGLLVIASYNWGEHRVARKVQQLGAPQAIPSGAFDGIAETPRARSYWHFLNTYRDRMPEETKDYVMKIFAAAVIGENPRLFGFDFDNPLAPYVTSASF